VPASGGLANAEGVPADQVIPVLMNALHHFLQRRYAWNMLASKLPSTKTPKIGPCCSTRICWRPGWRSPSVSSLHYLIAIIPDSLTIWQSLP